MRIFKEMSIKDFKCWGGAIDMYERLDDNDLEILDDFFEEMCECGVIDECSVNDMLWFEDYYLITEILEKDYEEFYSAY